MAEEEVALLKLEIARLNRIINVLVEQHEIIKQKTGPRKHRDGNPSLPESPLSNHEGILSQNKPSLSNQGGNRSQAERALSNHGGNSDLTIRASISHGGNSSKEIAAVAQKELDSLTYSDVPVPLQSTLYITGGVKTAVWDLCHPQMHQSFVDNACAVIIHFHNGGFGDYPTLRKLTGLSKDGVGKFIGSLKRKNLIQRTGWQKFAPGARGKAGILEGWKSELSLRS